MAAITLNLDILLVDLCFFYVALSFTNTARSTATNTIVIYVFLNSTPIIQVYDVLQL